MKRHIFSEWVTQRAAAMEHELRVYVNLIAQDLSNVCISTCNFHTTV